MHNVKRVSAVIFTSPEPERLAAFYRQQLGIGFEDESHGPIQHHQEAWLAGTHLAIVKAPVKGPATTFEVDQLDPWVKRLSDAGCPPLHQVADLGDGKRMCRFVDPDGNRFQLIEIRQA